MARTKPAPKRAKPKIVLVLGGARSGKSEYAEARAFAKNRVQQQSGIRRHVGIAAAETEILLVTQLVEFLQAVNHEEDRWRGRGLVGGAARVVQRQQRGGGEGPAVLGGADQGHDFRREGGEGGEGTQKARDQGQAPGWVQVGGVLETSKPASGGLKIDVMIPKQVPQETHG